MSMAMEWTSNKKWSIKLAAFTSVRCVFCFDTQKSGGFFQLCAAQSNQATYVYSVESVQKLSLFEWRSFDRVALERNASNGHEWGEQKNQFDCK